RKDWREVARESSRGKHSNEKILLIGARDTPGLTFGSSGVRWYFSNPPCHCPWFRGGMVPTIGCHSTIDKPEWVSRVIPPTTTMANTRAQQTSNQSATWLCAGGSERSRARVNEMDRSIGQFYWFELGPQIVSLLSTIKGQKNGPLRHVAHLAAVHD